MLGTHSTTETHFWSKLKPQDAFFGPTRHGPVAHIWTMGRCGGTSRAVVVLRVVGHYFAASFVDSEVFNVRLQAQIGETLREILELLRSSLIIGQSHALNVLEMHSDYISGLFLRKSYTWNVYSHPGTNRNMSTRHETPSKKLLLCFNLLLVKACGKAFASA